MIQVSSSRLPLLFIMTYLLPKLSAFSPSTMTLLEHVNLNVPSHQHILPFYFSLLKCGMDPRKSDNLKPDAPKKTIWANCGASQFHLPYGDVGQAIPGLIGLRFDSLDGLKSRLKEKKWDCVKEFSIDTDSVTLCDQYGNRFLCRQTGPIAQGQQPLVPDNHEYGLEETECKGIQFIEFACPVGTASKIASFYEGVFDATTSVVRDDGDTVVAIIAFGTVDENGQAEQSLLFRETLTNDIPPYDGHHIAMYVGESPEDFEQAFRNADLAGIVWVNPRFSDKVTTIEGAREEKQFRFKNILDLETGEVVYELEHEVRSIAHKAWPRKREEVVESSVN